MNLTLEDIWTQFATRLRFFLRGRVADDATADDLLQSVFLKIQQRLGTLRGVEKLEAWVYQIARNVVADHYRTQKTAEPLPEDLAALDTDANAGERAGLMAAFRRMIDELPKPYREAILLTEIEGMPQKALAEKLGISVSGAKSRVQRGRVMLKEMLLECCRFEFDRRGGVIECEPRRQTSCRECGAPKTGTVTVDR